MTVKDEKVYSVEINGKECGFFLEPKDGDTVHLRIPDCGGMADSEPRVPDQLSWIEDRMNKVLGAKRIWTTVWDLQTPESIAAVEEMLSRAGELCRKPRSDFYRNIKKYDDLQ